MVKTYDRLTQAAVLAHEVNRVWCQLNGDDSQPSWEDAPDWQKDSAYQGVNFHIQNPGAGDSSSHDNWMKQKVADGWVYGELKDPEKKTHPCMVPFTDLPVNQQIKDALFRSIVHALLPPVGTEVTDVNFNPSGNPEIHAIKTKGNELTTEIGFLPPGRRRSIALTRLEDALMWAVKAAAVGDS